VDLSDELLIQRFNQTKDSTFFKSLIRRYQNKIYNTAYRILGNADEAEEVVQDTLVKVHQSIDKFRQQASFNAWLFRIVHNICLDRLRYKQRRKGFQVVCFDPQSSYSEEESGDPNTVSQVADANPGPDLLLSLGEQSQVIGESLKLLPDNQRAVVVLFDIEGFSYQEISEIVGASIGTVRSRLHYGRLKLRELLEPYFQSKLSPSSR
jgi:RNA polymerase sigma-70 factor (ECF subfamily)